MELLSSMGRRTALPLPFPPLLLLFLFAIFASPVAAFGAGNIASISAIEGKNWRHGDIEDMLKMVACVKGYKWSSLMIKRVYFGNWLRDYSQAMDTATLSKAQPETIRILVWILSFMSFGYATAEFEVTPERLGVYRPEEHIDNPKNYNDDKDAREIHPQLRGPVRPIELEVDPETGMKNYIANGRGDWATSAAYVRYSFERSIHHGRRHAEGRGLLRKGDDEELAEALRYLGQGLHCMEDFGAHSNYVELALRELGWHNVFPLTGTATGINLRGKHTFPLVTGTFGMVDFFHSVLGEASDKFTQSELNDADAKLGRAQAASQSSNPLSSFTGMLSKVPGTRSLAEEAEQLQASSQAQARSVPQDQTSRAGDGFSGMASPSQATWHDPNSGYAAQSYSEQHQQQQQHHHHHHHQWSQPHQPQWGQQQQQQQPSAWDPNQHHSPQWSHPPHEQAQWGHQQHQSWAPPQQSGGWDQNQWHQSPSQPHASWNQIPPQPHDQWGHQQQLPSDMSGQYAHGHQGLEDEQERAFGLENVDPVKTARQIYPILVFRDKVVRSINTVISKIPGLEAIVDKVTETLTIFIFSLLAPFIRPLLKVLTKQLQSSSSVVIKSSGRHQYEPWTDPYCTDPTHSMLSKDHFSNILNEPAGQVASEILQFVAPRIIYAWDNPKESVQHVLDECVAVFHHPALRDTRNEAHRKMFEVVKAWSRSPHGGGAYDLNDLLSSEAVRAHRNHINKGGNHASAPGSTG